MKGAVLADLRLNPVDNLKISFQRERSGVVSLGLAGYIDTYNAGKFAAEIRKIIALGSSKLLIDLSRVNYISSSGIGVLIEFTNLLKKQGGDLALLNPQRSVEEVFTILGFAPFANLVHSTKEELIDSFFCRAPSAGKSFPFTFRCRICAKQLLVRKAGTFRCPECRTVLGITEDLRIALR
jgi:anti-anti-sigma factor